MKLLFDQNMSFELCRQLADLFPASSQMRLLGLDQADDRTIWEHAKAARETRCNNITASISLAVNRAR